MLYADLVAPLGRSLWGEKWMTPAALCSGIAESRIRYAFAQEDKKALEKFALTMIDAMFIEAERRQRRVAEIKALVKGDMDIMMAAEVPDDWPRR